MFKNNLLKFLSVFLLLLLFIGVKYSNNIKYFFVKQLNHQVFEENKFDTPINELIENINISESDNSKYDRSEYTSSYQSYNLNGKKFTSIRNYSYYASKHYDSNSDVYTDPYTDKELKIKGSQFDHIIPLSYANSHGSSNWSQEKKREYADDPTIGVDVNSHDNEAKSDKGPSEWLPNKNVEEYCYSWLIIADKYDISISKKDMDVIKEKLNNKAEINIINEYR